MEYFVILAFSYILGSSNMAYYISRYTGVNFRDKGSKNLGASNATMLLGWRAGIAVGAHDIGKALLAVLLTKWLFPALPYGAAAAGAAAVAGHIFPFYLKFHGGKGLAPYIGMSLALQWKLTLGILAVAVVLVLITDYMVAGTAFTVIGVPAGVGLLSGSWISPLILMTAAWVVLYRHRDNFQRILRGTEIRFRGASRGDHRVERR